MSTSKVVLVDYHYQEAFKVPKGLDLEDKTKVTEWWVKWNTLHITLVDGTTLEIQPEWGNVGDCLKYPSDEPTIEDAEDYGLEDEEELPPQTMAEHLDVTNKVIECDDEAECVCLHGKRWIDGECGECKSLDSQGL